MSGPLVEGREVIASTSRFGPRLCDSCNELFSVIESKLEQGQTGWVGVNCPTLSTLRNAVRPSCQFCIMLEPDIQAVGSKVRRDTLKLVASINYNNCFDYISFDLRSALHTTQYVSMTGAPADVFAYPGTSCREKVRNELASMKAYHDLNYVPPVSTENLPAWQLCRSWIDNCINNHDRCKSPSDRAGAWWPTRLLYIGSPNDGDLSGLKIPLHPTQDKQPHGSYMTLSHCWGDSKNMIKLTKDTYEHRTKHGFSYAELPKTFQDFVRLSRFLRNDFIWIDSLCIIQDSTDDWIRESQTMADVYQHSKCNIAATASQAPSEGCFYPRDPTRLPPLEVMLSKKRYLFFNKDLWYNNVEQAPLNRRSWVLQERVLAPRQIHCGREQLFWECYQTTACETFPFMFDFHEELSMATTNSLNVELTGLGLTMLEMSKLRFSGARYDWFPTDSHTTYAEIDKVCQFSHASRFEESLRRLEGASPEERFANMRHNIYQYWSSIVEWYSSCELSYRNDKLVAVLGIASRIQDVLEDIDDYVAGLWRSQLPWQLAWGSVLNWKPSTGASPSYRNDHGGTHLMAPSYDIAPSWSWACLNTKIYFPNFLGLETIALIEILNVHDGHKSAVRGTVDSVPESPLTLRCLLYKIHTCEGPDYILPNNYKQDDVKSITLEDPKLELNVDKIEMDSTESRDFWEQAYMLPITCDYSNYLVGIVVRPCQGRPGFYRRIASWSDIAFRASPGFAGACGGRLAQHARSVMDEDRMTITLI
ncbi:heterokaryon incompatibility protein-domain-containing protein [Annulohypoxylon truncatum]|uniref:heterokaryon incompatibility protein-domain-containing protein n=1 Tax=Annulohypoxylon truncatum TaxID=327061 RepID=UPI00200868A0|nr:heterokaryon incompatibility protein-domain-containing protein [Annulohypoxylon truncatum]KAI1209917.1 heterokaryon incompatibility protein-domain-containing protein [Annulohypoxylon truncatum]